MLPLAAPAAVPLDTDTSPDFADASFEPIVTPPLMLSAASALPDVNVILPPDATLLSPATIRTLPPTREMSPPLPVGLSPLCTRTAPEDPSAAEPVSTCMLPDSPSATEDAVSICSCVCWEDAAELPERIVTDPPVPDPADAPAEIDTSENSPWALLPALNERDPDALAPAPEPSTVLPLPSPLLDPLPMETTPELAASSLDTFSAPLATESLELSIDIAPLSPLLLDPVLKETSPPMPLELDALPA